MRGTRRALGCMFAGLLVYGCAGSAPAPTATERQAVALNQRATRAFEQGDHSRAAALYESALRLNIAIENVDGIAVNALSLARAHQAGDDAPAAHRALDRLLANGPLEFPRERRAEAQARKALLYLDAGDAARAAESSGQALASCGDCPALAAIQVLSGRAALAGGDYAAALQWAARALATSVQPVERANALRLTGEVRLARGEHQAALQPLEQALEIDRGMGLPARIFRDLMALGRAQLQLGNRVAARNLFTRAREVSEAAGIVEGARAAGRAADGL